MSMIEILVRKWRAITWTGSAASCCAHAPLNIAFY